MTVTFLDLLVWIVVALVVGAVGELIAGRRAPDGLIGAIVLGFLAIFLVVGLLHFRIDGEPTVGGVPLVSSILAAIVLVVLWSGFAYPRYRRRF